MDWLVQDLMSNAVALVAPLALYIVVRRSLGQQTPGGKKLGLYSTPGWNYHLKRIWAWFCLWRSSPHVKLPESNVCPILPSVYERNQEKPKKITREKSMDSMLIYGVDEKGNCLVTRMVRKFHRQSEVWLHLALEDGSVYQLPGHPDTTAPSVNTKSFKAADLTFTQLEPMRKWRISFNGTLRKGKQNQWKATQEEDSMVHVRLNFIWTACSLPCDVRANWSNSLMSEALAKEPWRSGQWSTMVDQEPVGYSQFGVLDGLVREGEADAGVRLYLRGGRERRWGEVDEGNLQRAVRLQGVASNGEFFSVQATCREDGLTQAKWGIVRSTTGKTLSMTSCDLNLPDIAHHKNMPRQALLHFTAGKKNFSASIQFEENSNAVLYSGHPWKLKTYLRKVQFNLGGHQGLGIAEFTYRFRGSYPITGLPPVGPLAASPWDSREGLPPVVCGLDERSAQVEGLVGGKGMSLALLTAAQQDHQFSVPEGFCVTTEAYTKQLASRPDLRAAIQRVKDVATGAKEGDLKVACDKAISLFESTEICNEVKHPVKKYLSFYRSKTVFAVRSSAIGEDSEDLSCAGQNVSVLGVKPDAVLPAIAKCWASLYSENSVQYRRQNGQLLDPGMGVVVQKMVPADTAGVLFTRHPFSGNPRQLVITANYGLGESVVSAMVEPDTVVVARSWDDANFSIQEVKLGAKEEGIALELEGDCGTKSVKTSDNDKKRLCLSEDQLLRLAQVGVKLEKLYCGARDIEWAISKNKIHLLQARPITALNAWTDFELEHEFDSPVVIPGELVTFANTGEVLPGATKPLTHSVLVRLLDLDLQTACSKRNSERSVIPQYQSIVGSTAHHIVLNVINTLLSTNEATISVNNKVMDLAIFGRLVTNVEFHTLGVERFGIMSKMDKLRMVFNMIKDTMSAGKIETNSKLNLKKLSLRADDHSAATSLYTAITNNFPFISQAAEVHGHMSGVSVFTQVAAMTVLTEGNEEWTTQHYTDISLLLSSCTGVESAEIPTQLRELARTISEEDAMFFQTTDAQRALAWMQTESDTAPKFRAFLSAHGHRAIREFELQTMTWGMQPEGLVETLQSLVRSPQTNPDRTTTLDVEETCKILQSPTKEGTRRALRWLLPLCRTAVARRERSKSALISALQVFRLSYRRLAQLMVREGFLPETELLFYLSHHELGQLIRRREPALLAKATRRRRLWASWESQKYEEIISGVPEPLKKSDELLLKEGEEHLQATPVCAGVVLGRACVISELAQTQYLVKGDILITHSTDIGWSPFFPLISGIVTELGGLISHGAVVAREYGLPCIVGAKNATLLFKTGDLVRLNGGSGVLERIVEQL